MACVECERSKQSRAPREERKEKDKNRLEGGNKKKIIKSAVLEINTGQKGLKVPDKKIAAIFRNGVDITSGDVSRRLTFLKGPECEIELPLVVREGAATIYWIPPRATARQAFDCLFPRLMRKKKKTVDRVVPLKMLAASVNGAGGEARSRGFDSNVLLPLPNLTLTLCVSGCKRVGESFQKRMKNSSGRENRGWVRSSQALKRVAPGSRGIGCTAPTLR